MSDLCRDMKQIVVREVVVGKKCDVCFADIPPSDRTSIQPNHPYYRITTHHMDWGNDSADSYEYYDACCPECVMKLAQKYLADNWDGNNSRTISIRHCNGWYLPKEVAEDA